MRSFIRLLLCGAVLFFTSIPAIAGPVVFGTMSGATVRVTSSISVLDGTTMSSPSVDVRNSALSVYGDGQSQLIEYTILTTTSGNGTISCPPYVEHGFSTVCTVSPSPGNNINAVSGCGGTLSGTLFTTGAITGDCTVTAAFNLDLPPVVATAPTAVDFGNFLMGNGPANAVVTITNSGSGNPLSVTGLALSGLTADEFSFASGGSAPCPAPPFNLNAGVSCTMSVIFTPATTGQKSATLQIDTNDPVTPHYPLSLTGAAVNQHHTLALAFSGTGGGSVLFSSDDSSCSVNCTQSIPNAATVSLTPTATPGSSFIGWSGCDAITNNVCSVTLTNGRNVTATFTLDAAAGSFAWHGIGPAGNTVNALAVNPATTAILYAGTTSGVYKSDDAGITWNLVGLAASKINALAVNPATPSTIYAGTDSGMFKSADSGTSWTGQGLTSAKVQALAIDPATPATLYAGTETGVFKSADSAGSWDQLDLGGAVSVLSLAIAPAPPGTIHAGGSNGYLYSSMTNGNTWTAGSQVAFHYVTVQIGVNCMPYPPFTCFPVYSQIMVGDPISSLAINPVLPEQLTAGSTVGIRRSTDSGVTWSSQTLTRSITSLAIDATNPATIFAGTADGVFKTTDNGTTWEAVNSGLTTLNTRALAFDPAGYKTIYAGTAGDGVFMASFASTIALSPASLAFGNVATNSISNSQSVTINNPSTADLVVAAVRLGGVNSGEFSVTAGDCGSLAPTVAPGSSCSVNITFTPTTVGSKTATLLVDSNASNAPTASASLNGSAYDPPPFGFITINNGAPYTSSKEVTLTLNALDNSGVVAEMRFSNDNSVWSSWNLYDTAKSWSLMPLGGDGTKTVFVQFRDSAGNASGSFADTIILDTTPPTVTITSKPAALYASKSGTISFAAGETASFYCSLDGATATPCSSPWSFSGINDGGHTLSVHAVDLAGLTGPATSHTWTVDTTAPEVLFTVRPSNPTDQKGGSFSFTANEPGSGFHCSLDNAAWSGCTTPFSFSPLADGSHNFRARAIDPAGNIGTPTSYTWTIDTSVPPAVKIGANGYATLAAALAAATDGASLQLRSTITPEAITHNGTTTLKFTGGYDGSWTRLANTVSPVGKVTITSGKLIFHGVVIRNQQ